MAQAVEAHWPGALSGLVVTRYGHGVPCRRIEVVEAAHPRARRRRARGGQAHPRRGRPGSAADDLVLCLLSGGASALLALPAPGLTLADKQAVTRALLRSGATIGEINCVRKHLSAIKGGRLAAAALRRRAVVTLAISDVPGDDPAVIGSGPTVADPTTFADARAHPRPLRDRAAACGRGTSRRAGADETPKPGDPRLARSGYRADRDAAARRSTAAAAAARDGRGDAGRSSAMRSRARRARRAGPRRHRAQAAAGRLVAGDRALPLPAVLLSGGETTVTVRGTGRGGRNAEFLLALALALDGASGIHALACDTDGIDGTEDNAGAVDRSRHDGARRAIRGSISTALLADNDAWSAFHALGDLRGDRPDAHQRQRFSCAFVVAGEGLMRRQRSAKIVATLGPASSTPEMIEALFRAGVDVFRLNFSHGTQEEHRARLRRHPRARKARTAGRSAVMADLQGPKLRVGTFAGGKARLVAGKPFRLDLDKTPGDAKRAPLPHPEIFAALEPGTELLLDDGNIRLKVERCGKDFAETDGRHRRRAVGPQGRQRAECGAAAHRRSRRRTAPISPSRSTWASTGSRSPSCSGPTTWPRRASSSPAAPACWSSSRSRRRSAGSTRSSSWPTR